MDLKGKNMKKIIHIIAGFLIVILFIFFVYFIYVHRVLKTDINSQKAQSSSLEISDAKLGKKVLYINSYHRGYEWSDGLYNTIIKELNITINKKDSLDFSESSVDFKSFHMDTKRNFSDSSIQQKVQEVRALIDSWKPDVVIASDDNVSKYVIVPHYKDSDIPFIFCGINWTVDEYGFPFTNVTGIISVHLVDQMLMKMKKIAKGSRIGFLKGDNISSRKDVEAYEKYFRIKLDSRLVKNFSEWKREYLKLQEESDMIILGNEASIENWDADKALDFINKHTKVPSATSDVWMRYYTLFTIPNSPTEQGEWSVQAAMDIINGKSISEIPITRNRQSSQFINMKLAKKLNYILDDSDVDNAKLFNGDKSKVLYINSYHEGYYWSDNIEKGLLKGLKLKNSQSNILENEYIKLQMIRMDSKRENKTNQIKDRATEIQKIIKEWNPDIIVTSDDNAFKYVIHPYLLNTNIPILYCGVNWTDSIYGLPKKNIKGMVEIEPIKQAISFFDDYATTKKIGYLGANRLSEKKILPFSEHYGEFKFSTGKLVDTFEEWKSEFLKLQNEVDIIYFINPVGIKDWNEEEAITFVRKHIKIPTFTCMPGLVKLSVIGVVKVPEEQGWWLASTINKLTHGTLISNIQSTTNKNITIHVNTKLADKVNIHFPIKVLEKAVIEE